MVTGLRLRHLRRYGEIGRLLVKLPINATPVVPVARRGVGSAGRLISSVVAADGGGIGAAACVLSEGFA